MRECRAKYTRSCWQFVNCVNAFVNGSEHVYVSQATNRDIFPFFRGMIAIRKSHPSLCRSRFWREDISWYGVGPTVDLSQDSRSLSFCLHDASQTDDDIYGMINAYWEALQFQIQEGTPENWCESWTPICRVQTISPSTACRCSSRDIKLPRDRLLF